MIEVLLTAAESISPTPPPDSPPTLGELLDWGLRLLLALGGIGGIGALFMVRQQKRKMAADAGRTEAEADSIMADVGSKATDRADRVLSMQERVMRGMQERLDEAEARMDQLTSYVEILVQALRTANVAVPPMPRKMAEDARSGNHTPTNPEMVVVRP
ncbi:hypothetical protein [Geodermatophilus sp. DSM 45219]|uniref:hypothetical protein n=1 Tax=Geodermatophilus sp. DSM 45219 TaxID=1881103 RepID=UPI000890DF7E|nr:hypothetical protein [Geodermatophilus sp. DSM 45219]SDN79397.1 hypothetical protein SAMN05428965_1654 [Geodermatophilus sp. DSM 45219]